MKAKKIPNLNNGFNDRSDGRYEINGKILHAKNNESTAFYGL